MKYRVFKLTNSAKNKRHLVAWENICNSQDIQSGKRPENADVAQNMQLDGMILRSEEKGRGETHSDRGNKTTRWTSSGAQCLRIHLPMQEMWV